MKRTSKTLLYSTIILFLVMAGIICVIVFFEPDPQSDVIVSYQRPASFAPAVSNPSEATPFETAAPAPAATATPLPAGQGNLMIQDPLGDPIPSGTIAFGSESITFSSGKVIVPATAPHELSVRVSADGYMPGEFTINPNSSSLVLDYLCDFSIFTEDEKGNPAPYTAIRVWKSNTPPRPTGDQATVYIPTKNLSSVNSFHIMRNEDRCITTWVSKPGDLRETYGGPEGEVFPKIGDLIMALGACPWQTGYTPLYNKKQPIVIWEDISPSAIQRSGRLRIWDSLCLAELPGSKQANHSIFPQVMEILRENQPQFCYYYFPKCPENLPLLYEGKTNDKCEFNLRGIPSALYFVQAIAGENRWSEILPMYPACGGVRLRLNGEGCLRVIVEKEGIPAKDNKFARIPDAEVILQSQSGVQIYSQKADDIGIAEYKKLPYGKYKITVKALGRTVEKEIVVNSGVNTYVVTFPHEKLFSITGIVLEQESGAPVAGYPLKLSSTRVGHFGYCVYQELITDKNGRFEFKNVLPGKYSLSENVISLGELKYVFYDSHISYGTLTKSNPSFCEISMNVSEDIHDFKVMVQPVVKTNFSGIVVDKDNLPVKNAVFTITPQFKGETSDHKALLFPEDFKTDANGLFSLTIFDSIRSLDKFYLFVICAMKGRVEPFQWIPGTEEPGSYMLVEDQFVSGSIGSVTVEGDIGDTFTDLHIVLNPLIADKTLFGKFVAEGEDQFNQVYIKTAMNNRDFFVQLNKDGYFKVENISGGEMTLEIAPCIPASVYTPNGLHKYNKYKNRTVKVQIEEGHSQTYIEIPLQRNGYFWGYARDSAGNPLPGIMVWAEEKPGSKGNRYVPPDQNGFFFIDWIHFEEGKKYNIKYRIGEQEKVMPAIPVNTGNLLLQ